VSRAHPLTVVPRAPVCLPAAAAPPGEDLKRLDKPSFHQIGYAIHEEGMCVPPPTVLPITHS
jgi:hypothetical protein